MKRVLRIWHWLTDPVDFESRCTSVEVFYSDGSEPVIYFCDLKGYHTDHQGRIGATTVYWRRKPTRV